MFNGQFPQSLGQPVSGKLEGNPTLKCLKLKNTATHQSKWSWQQKCSCACMTLTCHQHMDIIWDFFVNKKALHTLKCRTGQHFSRCCWSLIKVVVVVVVVMEAVSSHARIMGEDLMNQPLPVLFLLFKMEITSCAPIPLFESVHSGSASWDNCGWALLYELPVNSFPWQVPMLSLDRVVSTFQPHWVKCVCMFSCNLPPALLSEWPGSYMCYCLNTRGGMNTKIGVCTES